MTDVFDAELGGYAEVRALYQAGLDGTPWQVVERVRPRFTIEPTDRMSAEVVVEAGLFQGRDQAAEVVDLLKASELPLDGCTFYDPDDRFDEVDAYMSVERLHLDVHTSAIDLVIGRQPLRWGSGLAFHPTDLYAESLLAEPWREPRGINAIRGDIPVGGSQITLVAAVDDDLSPLYADPDDDDTELQEDDDVVALPTTSGAVRATLRALEADWSAVGHVASDGQWFAGADLRGTLGVGWWVEGGWHGTYGADADHEADGIEVVAGIDYSFPILQRFYVAAEYRLDDTGEAPGSYDYSSRFVGQDDILSCDFLVESTGRSRQTLGRHYVDQVTAIQFTQDVGLQNAVIVNLADGTGLVVPDVYANIGSHGAAHVGAQIPFGADGEFKPADEDLAYTVGATTADFSGLYPDATLLAWFRYSF